MVWTPSSKFIVFNISVVKDGNLKYITQHKILYNYISLMKLLMVSLTTKMIKRALCFQMAIISSFRWYIQSGLNFQCLDEWKFAIKWFKFSILAVFFVKLCKISYFMYFARLYNIWYGCCYQRSHEHGWLIFSERKKSKI